MNERNSVITALEMQVHLTDYVNSDYVDCIQVELLKDVLKLLESQAPRFLSLDEIVPGMVVYYEDRYYDDRKWVCEIEENKHKRFANSIILFGCGNITERDKSTYGETWRLWTGKPEEWMMKMEKWNEC